MERHSAACDGVAGHLSVVKLLVERGADNNNNNNNNNNIYSTAIGLEPGGRGL